jgi:hypothetical protein
MRTLRIFARSSRGQSERERRRLRRRRGPFEDIRPAFSSPLTILNCAAIGQFYEAPKATLPDGAPRTIGLGRTDADLARSCGRRRRLPWLGCNVRRGSDQKSGSEGAPSRTRTLARSWSGWKAPRSCARWAARPPYFRRRTIRGNCDACLGGAESRRRDDIRRPAA